MTGNEASGAEDGTVAGRLWSRFRGEGLDFQDIWEFNADEGFLRRMRIAEALKTGALANQVIGAGMDTHAFFGGEAEGEWTRDAKEYVMVTGSLLNVSGAFVDWLSGPEARKAQAKQQIAAIHQQAMDFKPEPFDWDARITVEQYKANTGIGWVQVSDRQAAEAARRNAEMETPYPTDDEAVRQFYTTTATAMNQSIMAIIIQANAQDARSSLTLGKAALQTLMTVKGQWDSEKAEDEPAPAPEAPAGPVYLPPRPDPPPGGGGITDPATVLAGAPPPPPGPVQALGGTAAALTPPSLNPGGGFAADSRPGPIGGFMGAPPVAGRGGRPSEEDRYARQWAVTEEDGEIWGTGTVTATDGGVLA